MPIGEKVTKSLNDLMIAKVENEATLLLASNNQSVASQFSPAGPASSSSLTANICSK
jgi:hypothetical protein